MNKEEFLSKLRERLSVLPYEDIDKSLSYYSEMIDDYIEDGMSEELAVAELGLIDDIAKQIINNTPHTEQIKPQVQKSTGLKVTEIVLLALGSPVWLPLLIAGVAILFSVLIVLWSLVISLYAIDLSLAVSGVAIFLASFMFIPIGEFAKMIFLIGAGFILVGLSILLFFVCNMAGKGCYLLCKNIIIGIKNVFTKKGDI